MNTTTRWFGGRGGTWSSANGHWAIARLDRTLDPRRYRIVETGNYRANHPAFATIDDAKRYVDQQEAARLEALESEPVQPVRLDYPDDDPRHGRGLSPDDIEAPAPEPELPAGQLRLTTHEGTFVVALKDGKLQVQEYDQSCSPWERGPKLVDLDAGPRWGKGWTVIDVDGHEHWYQSNWDSSD